MGRDVSRVKMGLLILQDANCILSRANKSVGPAGLRLSQPSRTGRGITDAQVAEARAVLDWLKSIRSEEDRRIVELMAAVSDCEPIHSSYSIAKMLSMSPSSVQRAVQRGILTIIDRLEREKLLAA